MASNGSKFTQHCREEVLKRIYGAHFHSKALIQCTLCDNKTTKRIIRPTQFCAQVWPIAVTVNCVDGNKKLLHLSRFQRFSIQNVQYKIMIQFHTKFGMSSCNSRPRFRAAAMFLLYTVQTITSMNFARLKLRYGTAYYLISTRQNEV